MLLAKRLKRALLLKPARVKHGVALAATIAGVDGHGLWRIYMGAEDCWNPKRLQRYIAGKLLGTKVCYNEGNEHERCSF